MISVLSSNMEQWNTSQPPIAMHWTAHTLQRIVSIGSLEEGSTLLSGLSSTAMCNLLVLLEQNIRILPKDTLGKFIENIEQLGFVCEDEWCRFLILRLKRHIHGTLSQCLVDFKDIASRVSSSSPVHEATVQEANHNGVEHAEESPDSCIVIPESEERFVPSPAHLRLPSPHLFGEGEVLCS